MMSFDEFRSQILSILSHLYDYAFLENHPLGTRFFRSSAARGATRAERLRRLLLQAIEEMAPPDSLAPDSMDRRSYNVLCARYVDNLCPQEAMAELALSERQYYREQRKAVDALANLLWERYLSLAEATDVREDASLDDSGDLVGEIASLVHQRERVNLEDLMEGILQSISPLSHVYHVAVSYEVRGLSSVYMNRVIARHAFLQFLSTLVSWQGMQRVHLTIGRSADNDCQVRTELEYGGGIPAETMDLEVTRELLAAIGGELGAMYTPVPGRACVSFTIPVTAGRTVLLVEDNPSAVKLLERYLLNSPYDLVATSDGAQAVTLIGENDPDVVVLDVMLPDVDGWEILRRIRQDPDIAAIPVLVCSVLDQGELAKALGASVYLRKPFSKQRLTEALDALYS